MDDDVKENRWCRPEGVGTDYLTDNQLYERVGQADAVYIERKSPDLLGLISTRGARENILRRIIRRMKEGRSRLHARHGYLWMRGKVFGDIY